jgi:excisionase family DNA binding protein
MEIKSDDRILVSISETCRLINMGKTKTYELIADGGLKTVRIGSRQLVTMDSIRHLVAKLLTENQNDPIRVLTDARQNEEQIITNS